MAERSSFEKIVACLLLTLGVFPLNLSALESIEDSGFCTRLHAQLGGYDPFGKNAFARDREVLGDRAVESGLKFLVRRVSLSELPDILKTPYLEGEGEKESLTLEPIGSAKVGQNFVTRLDLIEMGDRGRSPDGKKNGVATPVKVKLHREGSVLLVYSPRILSLVPWRFENTGSTFPTSSELGRICLATSCVTNQNSDYFLREFFEKIANYEGTEWVLRTRGPLPRYEIMGVLAPPIEKPIIEEMFERYPGLEDWRPRINIAFEFPEFPIKDFYYLPGHLFEVARDLDPTLMEEADEARGFFPTRVVVTKYSAKFLADVQRLVSDVAVPNFDTILQYLRPGRGLIGLSDLEHTRLFKLGLALSGDERFEDLQLPAILPDANLNRVGLIAVQTIRTWNFIIAEYKNPNGKTVVALLIRNLVKEDFPSDIPHILWALGEYNKESGALQWNWSLENQP